MQVKQTTSHFKAKNFICRLRDLITVPVVEVKAVAIELPEVKIKKPPRVLFRDSGLSQKDFDFERMRRLLTKKLKAKGVSIVEAKPIQPQKKEKRGIMDNIGKIFEYSHAADAKPTYYNQD